MNKKINFSNFTSYILILAGLVFSLLSATDFCSTQGCTVLHGVESYSLSMSVWGIIFFLFLLMLETFIKYDFISALDTMLLSCALGIEIILLWLQWSSSIWCPICLCVAATILLLCINKLCAAVKKTGFLKIKKKFATARGFLAPIGLAVGLLIAQQGVSIDLKAEPMLLPAELATSAPCIVKTGNRPAIRIYSDYLCLTCRKQEDVIDEIIQEASDEADIYFCDLPTHGRDSRIYISCFIASFLGDSSPDNILQARDILFELADSGIRERSLIETTLQQNDVCFKIDREAINACYKVMKSLAATDNIHLTPTVVVEQTDGEKRTFSGGFSKEEVLNVL